jgi:fructose-bisphosphate aldolase class II
LIRHVIVFNATAPEAEVRAMAARAKEVLGALPGVSEVRFGVALAEAARYRYFFDIGLQDEQALDTYRHHPLHLRFADDEFRPMAPDRITTDYRLS